jgi:hypothetical protein
MYTFLACVQIVADKTEKADGIKKYNQLVPNNPKREVRNE